MSRDEIKTEIFNFFKKSVSDDYKDVVNFNGIANIQNVRDLFRNQATRTTPVDETKTNLIILEIINQWVANGLLVFGNKNDLDSTASGWISVTTYGERCFEEDNILPFDPDGYIEQYKAIIPQVDDITLDYLGESITAYNRDLLLSSAITLGVASENIILNMIESFSQAIADRGARVRFQTRIRNRQISNQYETFKRELRNFNSQLPTELTRDLNTYLDGIFNFIRINRNQAGHPTGNRPNKNVMLHNLQVFVDYSKRVFALIDYFSSNRLT